MAAANNKNNLQIRFKWVLLLRLHHCLGNKCLVLGPLASVMLHSFLLLTYTPTHAVQKTNCSQWNNLPLSCGYTSVRVQNSGGKKRLEATKQAPDSTCVECGDGGQTQITFSWKIEKDARLVLPLWKVRRGKCLGAFHTLPLFSMTLLHSCSHQTVTVRASTFELLAYQCIPMPVQ